MYRYFTIDDNIKATDAVIDTPIERHGVGVYVESNPDDVGPTMFIDPLDTEGIKIFREFAAKMAAHYNTLKIKS